MICGFQSQRTLKLSHDAAMVKVDELSAQLKEERMKSVDLKKRLQSSSISTIKTEQVTAALHLEHVVLTDAPPNISNTDVVCLVAGADQ